MIVLAGTMMLTIVATSLVINASRTQDRVRFQKSAQNSTREIHDAITARLSGYIALLRGGTGFLAVDSDPSRAQFHQYAQRLSLETNYPGIQGMGFVRRDRPEETAGLVERMHAQGWPDFHLWPDSAQGDRFPVVLLEPQTPRTQSVMGFDMYSESARRAAMDRARDTGAAAATARVLPAARVPGELAPGFLIYVPVYAGGTIPDQVAERRRDLIGFIFSFFRCDDLFGGITDSDEDSAMHYAVYDSGGRGPEQPADLLFSTTNPPPKADSAALPAEAGLLQPQPIPMEVAGRDWTLVFHARHAFSTNSGLLEGGIVFSSGTALGLCLFVLSLGQVRARVAAEHNTAELRRSQAALRDSESRLRRLVDSNLIGVLIADGSGRTVEANEAFLRIAGYARQDLESDAIHWQQLFGPEIGTNAEAGNEPFEFDFTRKDGTHVPVLLGLAELGESGGMRAAFILDLTERKRDERERARLLASEQAACADAESANQSKDEFLATLSHELRTPLNAILGWAQLLRMGGLDTEEIDRALETIERNAKVQAQLVEDLLDLSRIISGKLRLELRPIELPPVIEAALDSVRPAAEAKGIRVVPVLDAHASPVLGDADRLQQVAWNLLSNAIKFTPPAGRVELYLQRSGDHAEISVVDTGQGIGPEFLPYVFERLRQADGSSTRRHGGLGLGLSIVRHLVEAHGGWVRAQSRGVGKGATFTVSLPLATRIIAPSPTGPLDAPAASGRAGVLGGQRALVVEDEPDARELICRVLERAGAEVSGVSSVAEALSNFPEFQPSVLVSDISMPGEDGYFLIRQIRNREVKDGGRIPAIAVTAFARTEDRHRALDAGFQAHVAKPFEPAEFVSLVARVTRAPRCWQSARPIKLPPVPIISIVRRTTDHCQRTSERA